MDLCKIRLVDRPTPGSQVLMMTDIPRYFWEIRYGRQAETNRTLFLATNHGNIQPKMYLAEEGPLFLGGEQGIFVVDVSTGILVEQVTDVTYFGTFELLTAGLVLAIAEDQLLAFNRQGKLSWRENFPDVIQHVEDHGDWLQVIGLENQQSCHETKTGERIRYPSTGFHRNIVPDLNKSVRSV